MQVFVRYSFSKALTFLNTTQIAAHLKDLFQVLSGYDFMNVYVPLFAPLYTKVENRDCKVQRISAIIKG